MKTACALPLFFLLARLGAAADLIGGPYAVDLRSDRASATICWVTAEAHVELQPPPPEGGPAAALRPSCVTFARLEPGRRYSYRIKELGKNGEGDFRMPPEDGASFRFAVFGDTQRRHDLQARMTKLIADGHPDFAVHTGDLVSEGLRTEDWARLLTLFEPLLRHTAFFPAMGNHDRNDPEYYALFHRRRPFYSFDWGGAHFTILYSDLDNFVSAQERDRFQSEQDEWLQGDLEAARGKAWRFVFCHHPPFSALKNRMLAPYRTLSWVPLFERYHVTAVFSGHDHDYQHHVQNGIHYVVSGGAGGNLDTPDTPLPITRKTASKENFVQVDVRPAGFAVSVIGSDGARIDWFEVGPPR